MDAMAFQITSLTIVYWTVYSGEDQRKHQSSASLAFFPGELPAQMASNAENVSIRWRHHEMNSYIHRFVWDLVTAQYPNFNRNVFQAYLTSLRVSVTLQKNKGKWICIDISLELVKSYKFTRNKKRQTIYIFVICISST